MPYCTAKNNLIARHRAVNRQTRVPSNVLYRTVDCLLATIWPILYPLDTVIHCFLLHPAKERGNVRVSSVCVSVCLSLSKITQISKHSRLGCTNFEIKIEWLHAPFFP